MNLQRGGHNMLERVPGCIYDRVVAAQLLVPGCFFFSVVAVSVVTEVPGLARLSVVAAVVLF